MSVTVISPKTTIEVSHKGGTVVVSRPDTDIVVAPAITVSGELGLVRGDNVGGGDAEVYRDKTGTILNFRTLTGVGNLAVSENGDQIELDGSAFVTGPAGLDNQLQFNNGGVFAGAPLYWDDTLLGFGGLADTNPALKAVGSELQARLGNDADFADFAVEDLTVHGGSIDAPAGPLSIGASIGANALTLAGATSYVDVPGVLRVGTELQIDTNDINSVNSLRFNMTPLDGSEEGRLIWDANEGTLCLGMPGGAVNLQIGQEFLVLARNNTGVTVTNGQVVYITGGVGNRPTIALADNVSLPQAAVLGMATEDIAHNTDGYVTTEGKVNDVNTSAWAPGTIMWLGSNGAIQPTRPDAPAYTVGIGQVVWQNVSQGSITMRPVVIPRLTSLSDVNIRETAIADENLVWWDAANSRWDQVTTATLSGSINHSSLLNLDANDHLQYTLRSDWLQNGFVDRTLSTLTWTDTSPDRTLSIQPTGASFTYFVAGVPYVSTGDTVQIADVEGVHWIYYDGATLTSVANPTSIQEGDLIKTKALVSVVYWDTSEGIEIYVGEERHGFSMSPDSHAYSHFLKGLQYEQGLGLNTLSVDGTGVTADAQFGVDSGLVVDEDLAIPISAVGSTTGLPIYYMTGAAADWNKYVQTGFSVRTYDGTDSTRLAWNEWTGSVWQLSEVGSNQFVLCHVFATTEKDYPMITVMGQNTYLTKPAAQSGATTEIETLVFGALPIPEIRPVATVIFKTNLTYTNVVNALVVSTADGDDYIDWRDEVISRRVVSTSDHGALTGRGNDDHTQYSLVDGTRAFTGAITAPGYDFTTDVSLSSPTNGTLQITETIGTTYPRLIFGLATTAYPALMRNGDDLEIRKGDFSNRSGLIAEKVSISNNNYFAFVGQSSIGCPADGYLRFYNSGFSGFTMLQFGGGSSTEPAWKRSTTNLHARLADDTGWAGLQCGDFTANGALAHAGSTAGFFSGTPATQPTVTGSKGGNAALASLLTALASLNLLVDSTT